MSSLNESYDWDSYYIKEGLVRASPFCVYCQASLDKTSATLDHYIPRSKGGTEVVLSCKPCNLAKADALPLNFIWSRT